MDDVVAAGKVRYIGFSEAPARKVAQAQIVAHFRGRVPLVALQSEYSLMERTAEGELIPMAEELGIGGLPWSPLKMGALSGKYTRANGATMQGHRGTFVGKFSEKQFDIIDALNAVAEQLGTDGATVALAWARSRPAVTSTVIGARTLQHLEANLASLDVTLTSEQIASLDAVSKPVLNSPAEFDANISPNFTHAGATVNGIASKRTGKVPTANMVRWYARRLASCAAKRTRNVRLHARKSALHERKVYGGTFDGLAARTAVVGRASSSNFTRGTLACRDF